MVECLPYMNQECSSVVENLLSMNWVVTSHHNLLLFHKVVYIKLFYAITMRFFIVIISEHHCKEQINLVCPRQGYHSLP